MATERRKRINLYVGPKVTVSRDDLAVMEATGEWVFEEKKDGFWCLAVVTNGVVTAMISRTGLEFSGAEVAGLVGRSVTPFGRGVGSGRVMGELTADPNAAGEKCGMRRLHVFDVLDWNGLDFRDFPQKERREALEFVYERGIACDVIHLVEQRTEGIVAWFDEIIARGGEGIVAKKKGTKLRAANADGKIEDWVRAKKKRTIDYVVMAHGVAEKGTPNVDLGLYKQTKAGVRLVKVCTCLIPPAWFKSVQPPDLVGRVVEAAGWEVFPSGALRHAQLNHRTGPRTDKQPESCTYEAAMAEA